MSEMPEPILTLRNISRTYGTAGQTQALRNVNLTVYPGEFVAIMGPSGAGKSTLLNILGLLDESSAGQYLIHGRDVRSLSESERNRLRSTTIGFVFQSSHLLIHETAADNAALGLKVQRVPFRIRRRQVALALRRLNLLSRSQEIGMNLSGGERQRVAIARAIATEPDIVLADEPTGALDTANSRNIIDHLKRLNRAGTTIVMITHDPNVAAAADRVVTLEDGVLEDLHTQNEDAKPSKVSDVDSSRVRGKWPHHRMLTTLWEEILEAISSHSVRPGRSALLLIAFLLGTGGLVSSLGISQSASAQISDRLTQAALDEVTVSPAAQNQAGDALSAADTADTGLNSSFFDDSKDDSTYDRISALPGVLGIGTVATVDKSDAPVSLLRTNSFQSQPEFGGTISIADSEYLRVQEVTTTPRQAASLLDNSWNGFAAILGSSAASKLDVPAAVPGARIWVKGHPVAVAGIIDSHGRDPGLDNSVLLSRNTSQLVRSSEARLIVRTEAGMPAPLAEAIPTTVNPASPGAVQVSTVADLRSLRYGVSTDLGVLVGLISLILLVLACLSAATAMYLSVQSRSQEIALRRALGASRASIWRIFTLEGAIIGTAGGIAGSAVGIVSVIIISIAQQWSPTLSLAFLGTGIAAGCITGILSATYPALVAARANPADAIRA
jgi:macrolide transport system ATP-binding/permease protein